MASQANSADESLRLGRRLSVARMFLGIGLTFFFMFTYTGPYRWFTEAELRWLGRFWVELTLVATVLAVFLAINFLEMALKPIVPSLRSAKAPGNDVSHLHRNKWWLLVCASIAFVTFGAHTWQQGRDAGPLTELSLQQRIKRLCLRFAGCE